MHRAKMAVVALLDHSGEAVSRARALPRNRQRPPPVVVGSITYPRVRKIFRLVSEAYQIDVAAILGRSLGRGGLGSTDVITPRQVAMYVTRTTSRLSLPQIGQLFGRDHTTVLYGVRRIATKMKSDLVLRAQVRQLLKAVAESPTCSTNL